MEGHWVRGSPRQTWDEVARDDQGVEYTASPGSEKRKMEGCYQVKMFNPC